MADTPRTQGGHRMADYWPLAALILISAATAGVLGLHIQGPMAWMHLFMGSFLVSFAMLKIFDINGFANGFQKYDLLAKRSRSYACLYPFLELGLGLSYLSMRHETLTYLLTLGLMLFGAAGVLLALRRGLNIACPCMGSALKVPLSTVTLTEDLGMAAMAAFMLAY